MSTMLFMILLSGLSLVLLSIILGQIGPAYFAQKGTKTVYAAQAGLQSALSTIRSASKLDVTGVLMGDIAKLPCAVDGDADGGDPSVRYEVTVRYYLDDPTSQSDAWRSLNKLNCTPGAGVSQQPNFAYLESRGTATSDPGLDNGSGNRGVAAVYKFKVSNVNIPGGLIYDFDKNRCMEAVPTGSGGVVQYNDRVRFVSASQCDADDVLQKWVYDTDYQIKLALTLADGAAGLCVTGPVWGNSTQDARLQTCKTDSSRFNQLWSWEGSHTWWGQKDPISQGRSGWCMTRSSTSDNGNFYLQVKQGGCSTFAPTPAVGAGAASYGTHQIVNYQEFGRCLDVTGEQIGAAYMIDYPCKQDPTGTGSNLNWNHKWYYQEPAAEQVSRPNQEIFVYVYNATNQKRCLQSPSGNGKYPTFKTCDNGADQKWNRIYNTGDYAGSYLFIDYQGRCLASDPNDRHDNVWSKITVSACTGSELQKWNAPASYNDATVGGFKELG